MVWQSHRVWHAKLERKITLYEVTWSEPQPGGAAISHAVWHRYATRTGSRMLSSLSHRNYQCDLRLHLSKPLVL